MMKGGREQHVVALAAVDGAAHRIDHQPARHGFALDTRMQRERGVEGLPGCPVLHELDAHEKAPAPDVAHLRVAAQRALEPFAQAGALFAHARQQAVAADHVLHGERCRAGDRMAQIGVAVLEKAAALLHRFHDAPLRHHGADRLVAAAQALGDGDQVGRHAFLFDRVQRAGAAHAAHHFVGDQQHAVAVAHFAHAAEVAGYRRNRARGGADHGFGHERHDRAGAQPFECLLQFLGQAFAVLLGAFAVALVAVGIAGRDVLHLDQQRRELRAAPGVAAHRQRAQRIAVVALAPRHDVAALGLADFDEILAGHLQRGFHGFRTARHEVGVRNARWRVGDQAVGQALGDLGGEEAGVRVGQRVDLRMHGGLDVGVVVPQAGNGSAARAVEIGAAGAVIDPHALAAYGDRGRLA